MAPRYPANAHAEPAWQLRVPSMPFPPYPAIRLSVPRILLVDAFLGRFDPAVVHVVTEGPLGLLGRRFALKREIPLVPSFHTHFARYSRDYEVPGLEPFPLQPVRNP